MSYLGKLVYPLFLLFSTCVTNFLDFYSYEYKNQTEEGTWNENE